MQFYVVYKKILVVWLSEFLFNNIFYFLDDPSITDDAWSCEITGIQDCYLDSVLAGLSWIAIRINLEQW